MNTNDLMKMLLGQQGNPIIMNVLSMLQKNDTRGVEDLARNLCREKGINADEFLDKIRKQFNLT